jgi:hypothetical protein
LASSKKTGEGEDRLILDKDVPEERGRLNLGTNPLDNDAVTEFTLESELERLSNELRGSKRSVADEKADSAEIKKLMRQAGEDRDKLSERGVVAFDYLMSKKEDWDR